MDGKQIGLKERADKIRDSLGSATRSAKMGEFFRDPPTGSFIEEQLANRRKDFLFGIKRAAEALPICWERIGAAQVRLQTGDHTAEVTGLDKEDGVHARNQVRRTDRLKGVTAARDLEVNSFTAQVIETGRFLPWMQTDEKGNVALTLLGNLVQRFHEQSRDRVFVVTGILRQSRAGRTKRIKGLGGKDDEQPPWANSEPRSHDCALCQCKFRVPLRQAVKCGLAGDHETLRIESFIHHFRLGLCIHHCNFIWKTVERVSGGTEAPAIVRPKIEHGY